MPKPQPLKVPQTLGFFIDYNYSLGFIIIGASQKDDWYIPGLPFYFAAILLIICIIPILKVMNTLEHAKKRKIK